MPKKFNITGTCYPKLHYMADISAKLKAVMAMVEAGDYFIINRPRQYGKTTMLAAIEGILSARVDYLPIRMNFQGVDRKWYESDAAFAQMVLRQLMDALEYQNKELFATLESRLKQSPDLYVLSKAITYLAHESNKKLVLLIDEVDASSNHQPFLSFLGMLRAKYLDRMAPQNLTFHSIILAGVHDIKTLKSKLRADDDSDKYNSPWNIAADFKVKMSLQPQEIIPMLEDYAQEQEVQLDAAVMADRIYYFTSGYPFLVSKLCKIMAESILPGKEEKALGDNELEQAVQLLLDENNTNFDNLIKNLENNQDLYNLAFEIIINGAAMPYNPDEPVSALGRLYGIFRENGRLSIHNRIYEQRLYNYMVAKVLKRKLDDQQAHTSTQFTKPDGQLDIERVLLKFQQYLKEQYSGRDANFLEREWRLIFLAFLKPIINGKGHDFKEVQISEEKRLDVAVTYNQYKYVIELKRWYGPKAHQNGLAQLSDYLDRQGLEEGYLIVFAPRQSTEQQQGWTVAEGKRVFVVWV
jgi:hypothetical protein